MQQWTDLYERVLTAKGVVKIPSSAMLALSNSKEYLRIMDLPGAVDSWSTNL